jgi:tRNA-specific 2-thiouridylase
MPVRCVALLSGGLDSMLAVRLMQRQGVEVEAVNFQTIFSCCRDQAAVAAQQLGVRLTVVGQQDDYLELIRAPRFGYGKGANPCVDCRIHMFQKARQFMEQVGAQFLVSGEVIGQRPMSQKKRDLFVISHHSQSDDLLLRPLSAKRLPPTLPEREGWVDRDQLYDFVGRGRKPLIRLARQFGFSDIPEPSNGCALTEVPFSRKVYDLLRSTPENNRWDFELLKYGRHFRSGPRHKVVVGRNESENQTLSYLHGLPEAGDSTLFEPDNFRGPTVLLVGPPDEAAREFAAGLLLRFGQEPRPLEPVVRAHDRRQPVRPLRPVLTERVRAATTVPESI